MEQLSLAVDGRSVLLPPRKGACWEDRLSPVKITRVLNVNAVKLRVADMFSLTAWVVPVTAEESRVHGFEITEEDCFAHLQLSFNFLKLSPHVTGVLGRTYSAGFESPVEVGAVLDGDDMFAVSHLFATDWDVAMFGKQK
ncbi:hypothetical protein E8P77_34235 [Soehngenia saccharolytica]|nr:hypothetical protein E8P77_34235 [Soehngenia saccharolytica]